MFKSNVKSKFKVNLYIFILILLLNVIIQNTCSKKLKKTTGLLDDGAICDLNRDCKSGYCAFAGDHIITTYPSRNSIRCIKYQGKKREEPCWWTDECGYDNAGKSLKCKWRGVQDFGDDYLKSASGYRCLN